MKNIKFPFSFLDVLAAIIPATLFCVGIFFIAWSSPQFNKDILELYDSLPKAITENNKVWSLGVLSIVIMASLFTLGHLIMAIGSIFIDRFIIGHGIGYPYKRLLDIQAKEKSWAYVSDQFHLLICFLIFVYSIAILCTGNKYIFYAGLSHVLVSIIFKFIASEKRNKMNKIDPNSQESIKLKEKGERIFDNIFKYTFFYKYIFNGLINLYYSIFRIKQLEPKINKKIRELFKERFHINVEEAGASAFWLPYIDVHENNPTTSDSLHYVRALYYFSRDLSAGFLSLFIITVCTTLIYGYSSLTRNIAVVFISLAVIFFIHFFNIYYNYYTKNTLRAFLSHSTNNSVPN